jgi:hypothetical protein
MARTMPPTQQIVISERRRRGWSIRTAAERGAVSNTTWGRFEAGHQLTGTMRQAVARAFTWPLSWPETTPAPTVIRSGEVVASILERLEVAEDRAEKLARIVAFLVERERERGSADWLADLAESSAAP